MSVEAIESGIGGVWYSKQSALGAQAASNAAGTKRLRKVGDNGFKPNKTYGEEEYVDGESFANPAMFVENVAGEVGTQEWQAQPDTAPMAFAQIGGVDTVSGGGDPYTHTLTSSGTSGSYGTWRQKTGSAVGPVRECYWDSKLSKLTWNCGQDQQVAHQTADVTALKAGEKFLTDPTAVDSGEDPYRWNEVTGSVTVGGVVLAEAEGEQLEIDRKLDVHKGDSVSPVAIIPTKGEIMRNVNAIVTANTLPLIYQTIYGSQTPTGGDLPSASVVTLTISTLYTRSASRTLSISTPNVAIAPDDFEVFPRAEGGKIPVVFGGRCLKAPASPALVIVAKTADSAAYV